MVAVWSEFSGLISEARDAIRRTAARSQRRTALTEELRQPLTAVIAYLEAIKSGHVSDPDALQTAVERASEQASRAGKIMHLLSDYEPYEIDQAEVVHLGSLLAEASLAAARSAQQAGVTIEYCLADDAEIRIDFQTTQKALDFLLLEAVEAASRKPKSRVTVSALQDANHICLSIATSPFEPPGEAEDSLTCGNKEIPSHRIALCRIILLQQGGELQWNTAGTAEVAFHCVLPIVTRSR